MEIEKHVTCMNIERKRVSMHWRRLRRRLEIWIYYLYQPRPGLLSTFSVLHYHITVCQNRTINFTNFIFLLIIWFFSVSKFTGATYILIGVMFYERVLLLITKNQKCSGWHIVYHFIYAIHVTWMIDPFHLFIIE